MIFTSAMLTALSTTKGYLKTNNFKTKSDFSSSSTYMFFKQNYFQIFSSQLFFSKNLFKKDQLQPNWGLTKIILKLSTLIPSDQNKVDISGIWSPWLYQCIMVIIMVIRTSGTTGYIYCRYRKIIKKANSVTLQYIWMLCIHLLSLSLP